MGVACYHEGTVGVHAWEWPVTMKAACMGVACYCYLVLGDPNETLVLGIHVVEGEKLCSK